MVQFAAVKRLAVTVGANQLGTAGQGTENPHADGTGIRLWIDVSPVYLAELEFHDAL